MEKATPLLELHQQLGAHITVFGGWEMPLRYKSELTEHHAVRQKAGLFDLSHMGEFLVRGPRSADFLQYMLTNDLRKLTPGRAQYTFLLNPEGGVLDDLIVYQIEPELFLLVVNAANIEKDWTWLTEHRPTGVDLQNISEETVLIALSGPESTHILSQVADKTILNALPYYACAKLSVGGIPDVLVATTGYTGEWTYELFVRKEKGQALWELLLNVEPAIQPAGLAARNTLRLEMGYLLCGTDMDELTTPLEAGVSWAVKLDKGAFVGREPLQRQKAAGLSRKLFGLLSDSPRSIPRNGMPLFSADGQEVGRITSGSLSPTLQRGIALGYLPPTYTWGDNVFMSIRGQTVPLTLTKPPFVQETSLTRKLKG